MIVICIDDDWFDKNTTQYCKQVRVPIGDWWPVKGQLYEVIGERRMSWSDSPFYELYEDPKRDYRTWNSKYFKEVEVDIQDIEYEEVLEGEY